MATSNLSIITISDLMVQDVELEQIRGKVTIYRKRYTTRSLNCHVAGTRINGSQRTYNGGGRGDNDTVPL